MKSGVDAVRIEILFSGHFDYSTSNSPSALPNGSCALEIVRYDNGVCGVMMSEEKNNRGPSITNACDRVATQIYYARLSEIPPDKIVWLEHCAASRNYKGHIDVLQFLREEPTVFSSPRWQRFFEAPVMSPLIFMQDYSFVLKELCTASMIFSLKDRKGYNWRVWANGSAFFIISANPSVMLSKEMLDIKGVTTAFHDNRHILAEPNAEKLFTNALMKGFLNDEI